MGLATVLLLLAANSLRTEASCFGRDASWSRGGKPTVTQPSRNDPSKVLVDWSKIVQNENCVDKYVVWLWPDGTLKTAKTAVKVEVAKTTKSKIVDVQACVGYRWAVELDESEMTGNQKFSGEILFKTTALPVVGRLDASSFTVGYHWDPVRKVSDLRLASVKFPRSLVQHASCLDYIQVTGEARRAARPSLSRTASTASMTGQVTWAHLPSSPLLTSGVASTLPAGIGGFRLPSQSSAGSISSRTRSRSSSGSSGYVSPFGPVEPPHYANSLPRKTGGTPHHAGPVKVQPPFLNPMVEILVAVQDCAEYNFEVKLFAPTSKEVKKVTAVHLPSLADIPDFIPPPVTNVMSITFGSSGRPTYGVKTSSGVSAACLPAYFEALDSYRQRLENEIGHLGGSGGQGSNLGGSTSTGSGGQGGNFGRGGSSSPPGYPPPPPPGGSVGQAGEANEEKALKTAGCMCTSPHLEFDTTDAKLKKSTPSLFGHYHYKGTSGGRPYYQRTAHSHSGSHSHTGHGHSASPASRPGSPAPNSPPSSTPTFLFWLPKDKQWWVGPTLGDKKGAEFSSVKNSLAVCPGDPQAVGNWQRKSSFLGRWKKEATLSMTCETNIL